MEVERFTIRKNFALIECESFVKNIVIFILNHYSNITKEMAEKYTGETEQ